MRFTTHLRHESPLKLLHIAPFASLVLLLFLLLFAVSSRGFFAPPGFGVAVAGALPGLPVLSGPNVLEIVLTASEMRVEGEPVSVAELESLLASVNARHPTVVVKAAGDTPSAAIQKIWQLCAKAGIEKINLLIE